LSSAQPAAEVSVPWGGPPSMLHLASISRPNPGCRWPTAMAAQRLQRGPVGVSASRRPRRDRASGRDHDPLPVQFVPTGQGQRDRQGQILGCHWLCPCQNTGGARGTQPQ
jgi:hypothetical protein